MLITVQPNPSGQLSLAQLSPSLFFFYIVNIVYNDNINKIVTLIFSPFKCGEFTLYEGNDGSQNQVCTLYWDQDTTFNFQHYDACENDETRSGILRGAEYGTIITLYDSPSGDKGDDYTEIKVC